MAKGKRARIGTPGGLQLDSVDLPAVAEGGFEKFVGFGVVGDAHFFGVVFELAFVAQGDDAEEHPFDEGGGDVEIGASVAATFGGADEVSHVAGGAGEQRGWHAVILHLFYREEPGVFTVGSGGENAFVAEEDAAVGGGADDFGAGGF